MPNASPSSLLRVAIVHEWFTTLAGSERVVEQLAMIYPQADFFFVMADPAMLAKTPFLHGRKVQTSFIQKLPWAQKAFRNYLALMPLAVEQFDLSSYDLILSSSHAVAKGVLTGPDQLHISYVHSPIRYAWDLQHQYLRESGLQAGFKSWLVRWMLHKIRIWDYRTAAGVDYFVANSKFICRRIKKVYGRDADVIHPPVDVAAFNVREEKEDFYLAASRLVPYKRMDLIVRAFARMPERRLVVIGDGPEMKKMVAVANGSSNIQLMGYQSFQVLKDHMQRAKAFVFAAEEDFGITPVEAQACGTPVIAFGKGGSLETVLGGEYEDHPTGLFFKEQTEEALIDAVARFEAQATQFSACNCRTHAEGFSSEHFRAQFLAYVAEKLAARVQ